MRRFDREVSPPLIRHASCRRALRGFGLLEAIVALVLLAGSGAALFAWINQNLASASRLAQAQQEAQLSLSAQALVDNVNPALEPSGQRTVSSLSVRWMSQVALPLRDGSSFSAGLVSNWQLGLYRTEVSAEDRVSGAKLTFTLLKLGMRPRPGTQGSNEP
jgi:general secretion pathway protein I